MVTESRVVTVGEAAVALHRSKQRIYELVNSGSLKCVRDGRSILIPREEIDAWIKRKLKQSGQWGRK